MLILDFSCVIDFPALRSGRNCDKLFLLNSRSPFRRVNSIRDTWDIWNYELRYDREGKEKCSWFLFLVVAFRIPSPVIVSIYDFFSVNILFGSYLVVISDRLFISVKNMLHGK